MDTHASTPRITVIGGGVIGLACAFRMAQRGASVQVFDRLRAGREASFAAGGMLAPSCESALHPWEGSEQNRNAMLDAAFASRDAYPTLSAELRELTGKSIELCLNACETGDWRQSGIFYAPSPSKKSDYAPKRDLLLQIGGTQSEWRGQEGVWIEADGQVENRKLVEALRAGCEALGVALHENTMVRRFVVQGERVIALELDNERIAVETALLCAGAWSGKMSGLPLEAIPPVRPLAGQMLQLRGERKITHVVYSDNCYLVPRRDGRLLIGATMEDIGFNKRVTAGGVAKLLNAAMELTPEVGTLPLETTWTGLRPVTPDGLPILGSGPLSNLFYATGHGRNGILMTPQTSLWLADAILEGTALPAAFSIARFAPTAGTVS